eukprot:CAMPEP_0113633868 /NCGR_PEP_ID=MMETSP0017_2-20120614/17630_1 /TAXON_ID=2856 /ORGANISM="Cylindrotheca closterium" /LENGTH=589 /DNA_ID=CAMNT_0000544533 /DNA_START=150 /DNA_END=1916 /DNA_ORIENTATION=- /assembly_acc=CAM_ASM_000147
MTNEQFEEIDLKAEKEHDKPSSSSSPYSSHRWEWWFPFWWASNRTRWSLSGCLRLPVFPVSLGSWLPSTTYGQALLYAIIWFQLAIALLFFFNSENGGEDAVESSGSLAKISLWVAFGLGQKQVASVALYLFGLSFDRMIPFHKIASIVAVAVAVLHGWLAYVNRFDLDGDSGDAAPNAALAKANAEPTTFTSVMDWSITGSDNWSGTYLTLAMALLTVTSLFAFLRRKTYYFWLLSHILFSVAVLVMGIIHFGVSVPLVIAWVADVFYRYVYKAGWKYPHKGTVKRLGETGVVRLSWPKTKSFFYQPGQFVKIGLPFADKLVYHPLSVASAPEVDEDEVVTYVRATGPWTNRLLEYSKVSSPAKKSSSEVSLGNAEATKDVKLYVEGPYGSMGIDLYAKRKHVLLCIGGGVGGATCLSMAKWMLAKDKVAKLRFVWSVREWELVKDALPDALWHHSGKVAIGKSRSQSAPNMFLETTTHSSNDEENQTSTGNLNQTRRGRLVETDLYLTKAPDSPPSEKTPTTTVFHGQRPKWDEIFEQTRKDAYRLGYSRVSVVCCGPMIGEIQRSCRRYSCSDGDVRVTFDLHEES